jgi:hypothetical protein
MFIGREGYRVCNGRAQGETVARAATGHILTLPPPRQWWRSAGLRSGAIQDGFQNTKLQGSSKFQNPEASLWRVRSREGSWGLVFGISLELGAWSLEFLHDSFPPSGINLTGQKACAAPACVLKASFRFSH